MAWPISILPIDEAMKRNPKSAVPYSNRAACYQKLMEWQLALKDAETCVEMDPAYVKGWSRKGAIHTYLKEFHKAMDAYNMVLKLEPENADAKQQLENVVYQVNASNQTGEADPERQKRAMADPEIQAILGDAQMRSILQEMQTDPAKAQKAMRDPTIAGKLEKLIAAGVHFEACPTSSWWTSGWRGPASERSHWPAHPLTRMVAAGASCGINSDDPAVFATSLSAEYSLAAERIGLTTEQMQQRVLDAADASFQSPAERRALKRVVRESFVRPAAA